MRRFAATIRGGVGLEPETIAYIQRVEADGGEVINKEYTNNVYKKLLELNLLSNLSFWYDAKCGIKKNINNNVSKMYSLTNQNDIIQNESTQQPLFSVDKIFFDIDRYFTNSASTINFKPLNPYTINTSSTVKSSGRMRFLNRLVSNDRVLLGFNPSGNLQHLLIEGAAIFIGLNGAPTSTTIGVINNKSNFSFSYNGSNNSANGFLFYLNNILTPGTNGSNTASLVNADFNQPDYIIGTTSVDNAYDMFNINCFNIVLNQSQITELNTL